MTVGYVVSAYKLPGQLDRLVRRLRTESSHFVVHVDRKTDDRVYDEMVARTRDLGSVDFVDRHVCHWGGFGHVRATLKGIERLYAEDIDFEAGRGRAGLHGPNIRSVLNRYTVNRVDSL